VGAKNSLKKYPLTELDLPRGKPRSFVEWKNLRRWDRLPSVERSIPGYLMRLAREESGLTQKNLARVLGTTQQAVAQAERWQSNPTVSFMRNWMKACGKNLELGFEKKH
jgi:DNA-binding XRE family transcriptional regulator